VGFMEDVELGYSDRALKKKKIKEIDLQRGFKELDENDIIKFPPIGAKLKLFTDYKLTFIFSLLPFLTYIDTWYRGVFFDPSLLFQPILYCIIFNLIGWVFHDTYTNPFKLMGYYSDKGKKSGEVMKGLFHISDDNESKGYEELRNRYFKYTFDPSYFVISYIIGGLLLGFSVYYFFLNILGGYYFLILITLISIFIIFNPIVILVLGFLRIAIFFADGFILECFEIQHFLNGLEKIDELNQEQKIKLMNSENFHTFREKLCTVGEILFQQGIKFIFLGITFNVVILVWNYLPWLGFTGAYTLTMLLSLGILLSSFGMLVFILPQYQIHQQLRELKERNLEIYQELLKKEYFSLSFLSSDKIKAEKEEILDRINVLEKLSEDVQKVGTWTYDFPEVLKILAGILITIVPFAFQIFLGA